MRFRGAVLATFAALLLALALPNDLFPYGSPLLGVVALAPLLAALYRTGSYAAAARLGVLFGAVSSVASNFWLIFFQSFSVWTLGGVTLAYAAYFALLGPLLRFIAGAPGRPGDPLTGRRSTLPRAYRPVAVAVLWTLYEFLKSSGFLGYPWGLIAYPVHGILPLVQFVDITGVWGLCLLMALINAVAAEWLDLLLGDRRARPRRVPARVWQTTAAAALLMVAALGYGVAALARPAAPAATLDVVLVQHNANPWQSGDDAGVLATLQRLSAEGMAAAPAPPDLVVWSETAVRWPVIAAPPAAAADPVVPAALTGLPVPLLTGVPWVVSEGPLAAMNASVLAAPGGAVLGHYGKQHLVPFAESVPFWEVPAVRRLFSDVIGLQATWVAGAAATIFELPLRDGSALRFATPICFEDAFPYLNRRFVRAGADMLINLTNDAWSQTVSAETQHFVAARLRAVENRRVLIRATNGGVTAAVDPWGRVIAAAPLFTEAALRIEVPVYRPAADTVYTRFGDYLPALLAALLAVLFVIRRRQERQTG